MSQMVLSNIDQEIVASYLTWALKKQRDHLSELLDSAEKHDIQPDEVAESIKQIEEGLRTARKKIGSKTF